MQGNHSFPELRLTDKNASGCGCGHGAGGCVCGGHGSGHGAHGHGHAHGGHAQHGHAGDDTATASALVTTELGVTGMTCGHCVMSVTEELSELDGVESVDVTLNAGGVSTVTVASRSALDPAAVRAAVSGAGRYSVVEG